MSIQHLDPFTEKPYIHPWILIEDGCTYEKKAIEKWFEWQPRTSPSLGKLDSATLMPNCAVANNESTDPISGKPFITPYYCIENCRTYELNTITDLYNKTVRERLAKHNYSAPLLKAPNSELEMNTITLIPNKILSQENIHHNKEPLVINRSMANFINEVPPASSLQPIFDNTIRQLINTYCSSYPKENGGSDESTEALNNRQQLSEKIRNRRQQLNLSTDTNPPDFVLPHDWLELSDLDLSNMKLSNINHKNQQVINANFANTQFTNCGFAQLVDCNLENSVFQSTSFLGAAFSIFRSNVINASFATDFYLERGTLCRAAKTDIELTDELTKRGAINADSIKII